MSIADAGNDFFSIDRIASFAGNRVTLRGWLHSRRTSNHILYLMIRDGSGLVGVVLKREMLGDDRFKFANELDLNQETAVCIKGVVVRNERAASGFEIVADEMEVRGQSQGYPITPKEHGIDFLMDRRHLWIRSERQIAILRVRHTIINSVRDFLNDQGFVLVDAPILTPARGTEDAFETPYFDGARAELATSGQLYTEATAMAVRRAYSFGPVFKMTRSRTRRHLAESWVAQPEMAYAELGHAISLAKDLIRRVVSDVVDPISGCSRLEDLKRLERNVENLERIDCCQTDMFPTVTHESAVKMLKQKGLPVEDGLQLSGQAETVLSGSYGLPLVVTHYPADLRPFNIKPDPVIPGASLSFELFGTEGIGAIISGGERVDNLGLLQSRMKERGMPVEQLDWYLDLCRYGSVPRSGFTVNIEALIMWICGLEHVREAIPFPRMMMRMHP